MAVWLQCFSSHQQTKHSLPEEGGKQGWYNMETTHWSDIKIFLFPPISLCSVCSELIHQTQDSQNKDTVNPTAEKKTTLTVSDRGIIPLLSILFTSLRVQKKIPKCETKQTTQNTFHHLPQPCRFCFYKLRFWDVHKLETRQCHYHLIKLLCESRSWRSIRIYLKSWCWPHNEWKSCVLSFLVVWQLVAESKEGRKPKQQAWRR